MLFARGRGVIKRQLMSILFVNYRPFKGLSAVGWKNANTHWQPTYVSYISYAYPLCILRSGSDQVPMRFRSGSDGNRGQVRGIK